MYSRVEPLPIDRVIVERVDQAKTGIPDCISYTVTGRTADVHQRHVQYQTLNSWKASACQLSMELQRPIVIRWRQTAYAKDISRVEIAR